MKLSFNERKIIQGNGFWALYDGFTTLYLIAFALALGANNTVVGLIGALPYIGALISEMPGSWLLERVSRMKIYAFSSYISRLMWVGIIVSPFIFPSNPLLYVIIFYSLSVIFDYLNDPAYTTLMADVVPTQRRGMFNARRQKLIGFFGMIAMLLGGWYLDLFTLPDLNGFVTMFAFGLLFGLLTTFTTLRVKAPPYQDHAHHNFKEYFRPEGDFKKFIIFVFVFNMSFMLASPLILAYMLRDLALPYALFAIAASIALIVKILVYKHIGRLSDKFGDKPILFMSVFGTAIVPFSFLFITPETLWLLWPVQIFNGLVWAGYDVTIFNMFLDLTTPDKRAVQNASYMIITSVPLIVAPILGGFIADNLTFLLAGIPLVFALSAAGRALSSFLLLSIPERRIQHEYPLTEVLHKAFQMHPMRGLQHSWHGVVKSIKKRGFLFTRNP